MSRTAGGGLEGGVSVSAVRVEKVWLGWCGKGEGNDTTFMSLRCHLEAGGGLVCSLFYLRYSNYGLHLFTTYLT